MVRSLLLIALVTGRLGVVAAQGPGAVGIHSQYAPRAFRPESATATSLTMKEESHWKQGMLIGAGAAVAVMLVGQVVLQGKCLSDNHDCGLSVPGVLIPFTVFALVGGLIGSTVH